MFPKQIVNYICFWKMERVNINHDFEIKVEIILDKIGRVIIFSYNIRLFFAYW